MKSEERVLAQNSQKRLIMKNELNKLLKVMNIDYRKIASQVWNEELRKGLCDRYEAGLSVTESEKYYILVCEKGTLGFLVKLSSDEKFKRGDMLKAANCSTPDRSGSFGNIFEADSRESVGWQGIGRPYNPIPVY